MAAELCSSFLLQCGTDVELPSDSCGVKKPDPFPRPVHLLLAPPHLGYVVYISELERRSSGFTRLRTVRGRCQSVWMEGVSVPGSCRDLRVRTANLRWRLDRMSPGDNHMEPEASRTFSSEWRRAEIPLWGNSSPTLDLIISCCFKWRPTSALQDSLMSRLE